MQAIMSASQKLLENLILYSTWVQLLARLNTGISAVRAAATLEPGYVQNVPRDWLSSFAVAAVTEGCE
jgi:hypothetical protein